MSPSIGGFVYRKPRALDYGFDCPDTFTRAFRRETGMTPSAFRSARVPVGRVMLAAGAYGPGVKRSGNVPLIMPLPEGASGNARIEKAGDGCVLYGVQRVWYRHEECTPFAASLRSCLNYLGQDIRYAYLMAATGTAFRLRWNPSCWDAGNVDIMNVFDDPEEAFVRGFRAAGRSCSFMRREASTTKADFAGFIRAEIDAGRPVIALGIIGPPEACVIAGYRAGGETLLGWNFFQEGPEFGGGRIDDSGYFATDRWWENPSTRLLMAIGEDRAEAPDVSEILREALDVLKRETVTHPNGCVHRGGQAAYRAWATAFSNDADYPEGMPLPLLFERLMCNDDALMMVGEGRAYAAAWLRELADSLAGEIRLIPEYREPREKRALALTNPEVRTKIVERIMRAGELDRGGAAAIRELLGSWR